MKRMPFPQVAKVAYEILSSCGYDYLNDANELFDSYCVMLWLDIKRIRRMHVG